MPRSAATSLRSTAVRIAFLAAFLPGCAAQYLTANQGNYLTFEYPFTEPAAGAALREAQGLCAGRKLEAVRSENACTLTSCTTTYQCMDRNEAAIFRK